MPVEWTKSRVVNFTEKFARPYLEVLVGLDGRAYDQAFFHKLLADAGVVRDVDQTGSPEDVRQRRAKRWDSYLGKIREFGLGFAVEEKRQGGPPKTIWRASPIAKCFVAQEVSYRQFMALQLMRFQLPKASMPIQPNAKKELDRGARVRPLGLVIEALDWLSERGEPAYLSANEIFRYLTDVESHQQLEKAMRPILEARHAGAAHDEPPPPGSEEPPDEAEVGADAGTQVGAGAVYWDIWLNEFESTGYVRKLRLATETKLPLVILVRSLPRWEEARQLNSVIPMQAYKSDAASINAYFDFFTARPSSSEMEVLLMDERVVEIAVSAEASFDVADNSLEGSVDIVGALPIGTLVVLTGDAPADAMSKVFKVTANSPSVGPSRARVLLSPVMLRTDGLAIRTE